MGEHGWSGAAGEPRLARSEENVVLEIEDLSKTFGGVKAVKDVSLTVEPGTIHGLIGPNGAGKSTLFNLITGLYRPDKGMITYAGHRADGMTASKLAARGMGRTFQNLGLFHDLSVLENVMVGRYQHGSEGVLRTFVRTSAVRRRERQDREASAEILRSVGIGHLAHDHVGSLPYGFQKRVELARCLAMEPKLLLLDEPAAGMNTDEKRELMDVIASVRDRDVTVLLVEHDMDFVMNLATRVTVLNFGEVIAEGKPSEIQSSSAVIEAYLGVAE